MKAVTELRPYLDRVDQLEAKTLQLRQLVAHLDTYTEQLEAQFRRVFHLA